MNGNTRLSQALNSHPDVLELIVSLNPHDFQRLKNPALRKLMSPRISLKRVAHMAGISEADLLGRIHRLTGDASAAPPESDGAPVPASPRERPDWLAGIGDDDIAWIDVIQLDDTQGDPLPTIIAAWKAMEPGDTMGIMHRWEPQPLYDVWAKVGLQFYSQRVAPDLWRIYLHKPAADPEAAAE
jgi:hypothetical protein